MEKPMKQRLLLIVLYLSFISLGLPDTILGTVWPEMRHSFGRTLEYAGVLIGMTTIISAIASFGSGFVTKRFSTWAIITVCGFMTATAMFGYAFSPAWAMLLFFTVFFGIGQGAVDTAVNSYMSRHYSSRHMNWVHCCWGIGATGGPFIITTVFAMEASWRLGYAIIGTIQIGLALVFLFSKKLWGAAPSSGKTPHESVPSPSASPAIKAPQENHGSLSPGPLRMATASGMLFYFLYSGVEIVVGLWGASWLIERYRITPAAAAMTITLYWGALTAGRFLVGIFSEKFANRSLIRGGIAIIFFGAGMVALDVGCLISQMALVLIGLGAAPLYPTMMHDTPRRVGFAVSDRLTGFQVGSALAGATVIPPAVGVIAQHFTLVVFAPTLLLFSLLVLLAHEVSVRFSLLLSSKQV